MNKFQNGILAGDTNWNKESLRKYGEICKLDQKWIDCWSIANKNKEKGFTYDGIKNKTATSKFRSRLDRIFANFSEKRIDSISLIGEKPIKNKFFERRKVKTQLFASDHFGIVCELKMRID
ncbi:hypothetical protein MHBO_002771 [Bonamia ostreae]|uniref:Uncharacterized protein n=1 Tax=Bonamia ostreae TaxID=126728 RepID=A0ABV2ANH1_9EUKA